MNFVKDYLKNKENQVFLSELADVGIYNSQNMDQEIDPN